MATEERFIVNQMALQNFTDTGIGGSLFNLEGLQADLLTTVEEPYSIVVFAHHGVVTTTATFTAPPKRPTSFLQSIIDDIDRLQLRSNYHFKPSKHAVISAKLYIIQAFIRMGASFPRPSFVLNGEKGIIIKWANNGYTVRLNCLARALDDDYIYFENGEYDIEENVTIDTLHNRLNWLIQHGRQPLR